MLQGMRCCHNSGLNIRIFPLDSRGISRFITHDIGAQRYGTFKDLLGSDVVLAGGIHSTNRGAFRPPGKSWLAQNESESHFPFTYTLSPLAE